MLIGKNYNKPFRTDKTLTIPEIHKIFGINEKDFPQYMKSNSLVSRLIEPSKTQINKYSDLNIDYEKVKRGRKIVAIYFTFTPKKEFLTKNKKISKEKKILTQILTTFKGFRDWVMQNYKGEPIVIGAKGYNTDVIISLTETGYLHNNFSNKDLDRESAIAVWEWLYKNPHRLGKINMSRSEILTDNYKNASLAVMDAKTNEPATVSIQEVIIEEDTNSDNDNCTLIVTTHKKETNTIKDYFTVSSFKKTINQNLFL